MSQINKIRSVQTDVESLLLEAQKYRDSDALLVAAFYYKLKGKKLHGISAVEFLKLLVDGLLPFPDTITRCRRKLQEKRPELRGKTWKKRQELEKEFREDINEL